MRLPLLGSTREYALFDYLLVKLSKKNGLISVPSWAYQKPERAKNPYFHLHLPMKEGSLASGEAELIDQEHGSLGALYKIHFKEELNLLLPEATLERVVHLIKDCLLIKLAMSVYIGHLSPFFSRLIPINPDDYQRINAFVMKDIQEQLKKKGDYFSKLYESINGCSNKEQIAELFYMDDLRENVAPEIDLNLFDLSFEARLQSKDQGLSPYSIRSYGAYLDAIKNLESRLFSNYNIITFFMDDWTTLK